MLIAQLSDPHVPRKANSTRVSPTPMPPAFLLHRWKEGTGLVTHFVPIGTFPGPYPFA